MKRELWRAVPAFPAYEISNRGQIRRAVRSTNGSPAGRILKSWAGPGGERFIKLRCDGTSITCCIEALVIAAFKERKAS